MSGWKDWAIGEVVTESEFQSFVQDQVVQVYDDATDRDNTLGANVAEGMVCYLKDVDETQVYDGTDWVSTVGDITEVVAGDGLSGGGSSGSVTLSVDESALEITKSQVTDFAHASTHESGGTDEIEIAQSQVTGLDAGTEGFTALSNGTSGLSYQPVSHNYIINGAMDFDQREGPHDFGSRTYTLDRWTGARADSGAQVSQQDSNLANITKCARVQRLSGDTNTQAIGFQQNFENAGEELAGKDIVLSFYAKAGADFSSDFNVRIFTSSVDPSSATYVANGSISAGNADFDVALASSLSLTTNWVKYTVTGTVPTTANAFQLDFRILNITGTAGADDYYEITGVQLEAGSIATPFKRNANSIAGELAACQRYYQRFSSIAGKFATFGYGFTNSSTAARIGVPLLVKMRTGIDFDSGGVINVNGFENNSPITDLALFGFSPSQHMVTLEATSSGLTAGDPVALRGANDLDAFIEFESEL